MSLKRVKIIFLLLLLCSGPVAADPRGALSHLHELTLDNGMRFLLLPRKGAPVFTAYIRVVAGGVDEEMGRTGLAHLLEHMAFKGTSEIGTRDFPKEKLLLEKIEAVQSQMLHAPAAERASLGKTMQDLISQAGELVVKEEFSKIYQRNGAANLNATTSQDITSYFVTLPSPKLRLWAYLESSRLKDPVFREFYSERQVVGEERRMRVEDSPFGTLYETFLQLAFEKSPYRQPTIGYREDIGRLSASDLKAFYQKYYVPSNMVVALVGDFDLKEAEAVIRQYFGSIPASPPPPVPQVRESPPTKEKRVSVPFDASPSLVFGYLKPNMPHEDDYVFDVLQQILCEGQTSRLYREMVVRRKLVQNIACSSSTPGSRMENVFFVYASVHQGHQPQEVLKAFDEVVGDLRIRGVSEQELSKAKKNILSQWYFDLQSNEDIADSISYFEAVAGDWRYILNHQKKIQGIGSEDIQRIVSTYLIPERRRTVVLKPRKGKI
jgi:predicted Zn-dependent peptidase